MKQKIKEINLEKADLESKVNELSLLLETREEKIKDLQQQLFQKDSEHQHTQDENIGLMQVLDR